MMMRTATNAVVRLLLAPACPGCGHALSRPLDGPVCTDCWLGIPRLTDPLCDLCGDPLHASAAPFRLCPRCLTEPPPFELARSAGLHAGPLKALVHAFKYEQRRALARPLARLMLDAGANVLANADAVVPVPLHPWRTLRRGFNQADDLAEHLGLPVWKPIRRVRHGQPQASLNGRERRLNVTGAFARRRGLVVGLDRARSARLHNRTVVLIDDVMTTGATMEACCLALLEAGAGRVRVLTVARAPAPAPLPPRHPPRLWTAPRR